MENLSNGTDNRSRIRKPVPKKYFLSNPKSLIERIIEIVGEPDYAELNQFSDKQMIKFMDLKRNLSKHILYKGECEEKLLDGLLQGVLALTKSRKRHHNEVLRQFKQIFSVKQLECIFKAYNSLSIINDCEGQTSLKDVLYEFLYSADNVFLNSEDTEKFKKDIGDINPIVFDVFIDSILTLGKVKEKEDMISHLKKTE